MGIETLIATLKDYWFALIFFLLLILTIVIRKVKDKRRIKSESKKVEQKIKKSKQTEEPKPVEKNTAPQPMVESTFVDDFGLEELDEENKKKSVIEEIKELNTELSEDGQELDRQTKENIDKLREELQAVNRRKEEIRQYGLGLSKLFTKYKKREINIRRILNGMEKLLNARENKKKEQDQGRLYNQ